MDIRLDVSLAWDIIVFAVGMKVMVKPFENGFENGRIAAFETLNEKGWILWIFDGKLLGISRGWII